MTEQDLLTPAVTLDRRRPGRTSASTELVPLLRDPQAATISNGPDTLRYGSDQTSPSRGIAAAVLLSIPIWALLIGLVKLAF